MKFEIGYFLIYFLYLISYQMSRVFSRRIRDRLPFLMYTEELKLLTFMHLCCQLKSLYIIQRQRFKTLSSLYRRSSSVYVFRQERNEDTFA